MENIIKRTRKTDIKFYQNGKIEIASKVARQLMLAPGDRINVGIEDGEYYLYASHVEGLRGRHEAQCWATNPGGNHLRAYSKRLCDAVIEISKGKACQGLTVGEPVTHPVFGSMLPLIIRPI